MPLDLIVTTHDRPQWLETCLWSIRASAATVKDRTRILVVDDASEVRVDHLCKRVGADYLYLPEHHGYSPARVAAYERTDSPYLAFIDDDDVLLPRWHRLHLEKMADGFDVVSASYWETDRDLKRTRPIVLGLASLEGLRSNYVPINDGSLLRREAIAKETWRPDRDKVMMMSMWLALAAHGARFATIEEPVWLHRLHGSNMSAALDEQDARYRAEAIAQWT